MELDHVFCFVRSQSEAEHAVNQLGLVETYRRNHPGQGTSNICCCFDNAFVEFLWLTSEAEARAPHVTRLGLFERSQSKAFGSCPFGIAWRGTPTGQAPRMWSYMPSYLPAGMEITVAAECDDHRLPLVFQSPGNTAPQDWLPERRASLQQSKGLHTILDTILTVPADLAKAPMLNWLSDQGLIKVVASPIGDYSMKLDIGDAEGKLASRLVLPHI
jgi:hypothetical protein